MELFFFAIACAALGWFLARFVLRASDGSGFTPWARAHVSLGRGDWPTGVQEEDDERRWGRRGPTRSIVAVEPELRPALERVRPAVRLR